MHLQQHNIVIFIAVSYEVMPHLQVVQLYSNDLILSQRICVLMVTPLGNKAITQCFFAHFTSCNLLLLPFSTLSCTLGVLIIQTLFLFQTSRHISILIFQCLHGQYCNMILQNLIAITSLDPKLKVWFQVLLKHFMIPFTTSQCLWLGLNINMLTTSIVYAMSKLVPIMPYVQPSISSDQEAFDTCSLVGLDAKISIDYFQGS